MTNKLLLYSITAVLTVAKPAISIAQKDNKPKDQLKALSAKDKFVANDFRGALADFKELVANNPSDPGYLYHTGVCLVQVKKYDEGLEYLEKLSKTNPEYNKELHLFLGVCYHRQARLDEALKEFEKYKSLLTPKQLKDNDVNDYIAQCNTAKQLMTKPVNVKIDNMSELINSKFDDYSPSITADGKTMIFTSRRDDTKGGGVDAEYDGKFFEDIYITTFDDATGKWTEAEPVKGSLNSEGHDASLSISPDGKQIFIYKNEKEVTRSGDIFYSTLGKNDKWTAPKTLPSAINSSYFESSASLSADGKTLYFVSERRVKDAVGNGDIYMVQKIDKTTWGEPVNLGAVVNTVEDEVSVFIHPDGKTLFFSSKGHNSMGGYDIFKTVRNDKGIWSKPENLGYPINSVGDDLHFVLTTDNKTAYYSALNSEKGIGERDIYRIDMSNYVLFEGEKVESGPALSILMGDLVDAFAGQSVEAEVVITDESGAEVTRATSNADGGNYFFTLPANKKYFISVTKDGYKPVKESVDLPAGKKTTYTLVKHLILERNK